jgi:ABC-2 type transport system permease protein
MHDALLIAQREYLERVRSKAFLFTTLMVPLIMAGFMSAGIFSSLLGGGGKRVVVASPNAGLASAVAAQLKEGRRSAPQATVLAPATEADRAALIGQVDAKKIDGVLWLDGDRNGKFEAQYISRSASDIMTTGTMEQAVSRGRIRDQLIRRGLSQSDAAGTMASVDLKTLRVQGGRLKPANSMAGFLAAYGMIFLLYFTVLYYGMNVARSVIEEKTSRVFEVLLATTTPESMMAGKLLGVGAAGLTQIGIWILAAGAVGGSALAASAGGGDLSKLSVTPLQVIGFAVYFLLGYLFYSALSAALGAAAGSEQDVQQFSFLIAMPLVIGIVLMTYILANPNAPAVVALSLFPPCTPIVMYLRITAQEPPLWQLGLSLVLMVASIVAMLWIASRVYRVGILMYGKRATLPEILRWLRYS